MNKDHANSLDFQFQHECPILQLAQLATSTFYKLHTVSFCIKQ